MTEEYFAGDHPSYTSLQQSTPFAALYRVFALLVLERREEADLHLAELLRELPRGHVLAPDGSGFASFVRGVAHALRGEVDAALAEFEAARLHGGGWRTLFDRYQIADDPFGILGDLPTDPRFRAFLERITVEDEAFVEQLKAEVPELFDPSLAPDVPVEDVAKPVS